MKTKDCFQPLGWALSVLGAVIVGLGVAGYHIGLTAAILCICAGVGVVIAGAFGVLYGRKPEPGRLIGFIFILTAAMFAVVMTNVHFLCDDATDWTEDVTGYHEEYDGALRNAVHGARYQHGLSEPSATKYGLACEHQTLSASCPAGKVIRVVSALYGRTQPEAVCAGAVYTTQCRSTTSLTVVQDRCDGRQSCSVAASNSEFGDPCVGTVKYLEVQYECTDTDRPRGPNLALGRPTQQSSTGFDGVPERAVDGSQDGVYSTESCTHTQLEDNPWWRVDLGSSHNIGDVVIFNRQDCCSDRLSPFQLHVGDSPDVASNPPCGGDHVVPVGQAAVTVGCHGRRGRYVGILLPTRQYLTLCEVQVYEFEGLHGPNLALGRPTQQSSTGFDGVPARAVDGSQDGVYKAESCTHTQLEDNPWWRVDLGSSHNIGDVVIFNRQDCCSDRLSPFQLRVGDSPDVASNPPCGGDHVVPAGQAAVTVGCHGRTGRYVGILLPTRQYLTLCEVQVYEFEGPHGPNLALGRPAHQSSTGFDGVPERAVDGSQDGVYKAESCTHTQLEDSPWWRVDLGSSHNIGDVVIFNRQDCCSDRLSPFQLHVGDSPDVASNPPCGGDHVVPTGQAAVTVGCHGRRGRYVGILLPTRQYLTLCEVQVYEFEDVRLERLGCWADTANRSIPTVEGSDPRLDGPYQSRQRAIQKCRAVADSRNFTTFALQNGGWCASSAEADNTYRMYGPSAACRADGKGGPWANEVYRISQRGNMQNKLVCEHQSAFLECPESHQIRVIRANYGRTQPEATCSGPVHTTDCRSSNSLSVVKEMCDTQRSCRVSAENSVFGDPCVGTFKYLDVQYMCIPTQDMSGYLGCYEDSPERVFPADRKNSEQMTSALCIQHCRGYGHQYAATQYARECWCGSHDDFLGVGRPRPESECDRPCSGSSEEMCGGTWRMSVYRTDGSEGFTPPQPIETAGSQLQRLGCWGDAADRAVPSLEGTDLALDGRYQSRTDAVRKCRDAAARRGYTVFAIQNGGWCASSADAMQTYRRYGQSDACSADGEGGPWANEVYKIVTRPQLQPGLVCEHSTMSIQCPQEKVIRIHSAVYGRASSGSVCGVVYDGASCKSSTSLSVMQERCDGRGACSVVAGNDVFGDPCVGTFKYLAVEYECVGVSGYKGCYEDIKTRKFPADSMVSDEMTSEMCIRHCRGHGHTYAATQYSRECWCGSEDDFDLLGSSRPETECNKPCPGNADQWCGGTWRMSVYKVQDLQVCETSTTDTEYRYRWDLPRLTGSRFTFEVQANNDAHVALSSQNRDLDNMYEIVIGGWTNTQSVIRRNKQGVNHATVSTSEINSPTEYRTFWISWASDGTIAVGRGEETQPFMQWRDPDPLPIAYAGYTTGWGSTGRWRFCHTSLSAGAETQSALEDGRKKPPCSPCSRITLSLKVLTAILTPLTLLTWFLTYLRFRRTGNQSTGVADRNVVKLPPDIFTISTAPRTGATSDVIQQSTDAGNSDDPPPPYTSVQASTS